MSREPSYLLTFLAGFAFAVVIVGLPALLVGTLMGFDRGHWFYDAAGLAGVIVALIGWSEFHRMAREMRDPSPERDKDWFPI